MPVIETLLTNYPDYCPYEVVLSAMMDKSLEKCRERVLWGLEEGAVDVVVRPARNLLGRARLKLRPFGIDIRSMIQIGYMLTPLKKKIRERVEMEEGGMTHSNDKRPPLAGKARGGLLSLLCDTTCVGTCKRTLEIRRGKSNSYIDMFNFI